MQQVATLHPYFGICAMLFIAGGIFFALVWLAGKIGNSMASKSRQRLGLAVYECGPTPSKQANRINSQFFIYALIFILLDIEIVFLFPWAMIFKDMVNELAKFNLSMFAISEIVIFIVLLLIGFLYAFKKGAFTWQSIR